MPREFMRWFREHAKRDAEGNLSVSAEELKKEYPEVLDGVQKEATRQAKRKAICDSCYGYGLWAVGNAEPMGPIDAGEGYPTLPCPRCGVSVNPGKSES